MRLAQNVDIELLEEYFGKSKYKISYIIEVLGISRQALWKKRKGIVPFRASEIYVICDLLEIPSCDKEKIFEPKVEKEVY